MHGSLHCLFSQSVYLSICQSVNVNLSIRQFVNLSILIFSYFHIPTLHCYFLFAKAGLAGVVFTRSTIFCVTSGFAFR